MKTLLALFLVLCSAASAADIAGTWKGSAETPNGILERTFMFKVDGDKLTGETTSDRLGKSTIMNGKVEGDKVSFSITVRFQENDMQVKYSGVANGSDMKLTAEVADQKFEYVVKKVH